jgi:hypothetical protein
VRPPAGVTERFAKVNGVRVRYLVGGQGSPMVLLHGYAETGHMWRPIMPLLAQRHTVIVPVAVDVEKQEARFGDRVTKATVPDGSRNQLVAGTWDSTAVLLEAGAAIEATAGKLPYVKGY